MANGFIPKRIPLQRKPEGQVRIDWSNPLAKGLVGAWIFNEGSGSTIFDLTGNNNAVLENGTWAIAGGERSVLCNADQEIVTVASADATNPSGDITIFARIKPPSSIGDGGSGSTHGVINNYSAQYYIGITGSGNMQFNDYDVGSIDVDVGDWGVDWLTVGGTIYGTDATLYFKGDPVGTGTIDRSGAVNGETKLFNVDNNEDLDYDNPLDGEGSIVYIYNRGLSAPEFKSLDANPYQILQPRTQYIPIEFVVDGGGGFQAAWARHSNIMIGYKA